MKMAQNIIEKINPSQINSKEQAIQAMQNLKAMGLPSDIINKVNSYINSPLTNMALTGLKINKNEFQNGLQSVLGQQPDFSAGNTSHLLDGIDQLK